VKKFKYHSFPFLACLMVLAVCCSCSKPKPVIPKGILTRGQMVPVLVDIHIAQAATGLYSAGDSMHFTMGDYIPLILSEHHIEKAMYDTSIAFYTRNPEIMQDLYDDVINELSKKQGEVNGK
jgi:hypothetical protein